jgi:hypothetical protein
MNERGGGGGERERQKHGASHIERSPDERGTKKKLSRERADLDSIGPRMRCTAIIDYTSV